MFQYELSIVPTRYHMYVYEFESCTRSSDIPGTGSRYDSVQTYAVNQRSRVPNLMFPVDVKIYRM